MERSLILGLIFCAASTAQIVVINTDDIIEPDSRLNFNLNFAYLNARHLSGTGAPTLPCSATVNLSSFYTRTDAGAGNASLYLCGKTGSSSYSWEGPFLSSGGGSNLVLNNIPNTYAGGGLQDFSAMKTKPSASLIGSLPAASANNNVVYLIVDGASAGDCTGGSGTFRVWCASNGTSWVAVGGSGGGGGATATYQLTDLGVVRTSSTVLTIGGGCAPTTPCNVKFGDGVFSITAPATVTITSGNGTTLIWIDPAGPTIKAGIPASGMAVTCSACTSLTGTVFPANTIPIYTWTATSSAWDVTGGTSKRAYIGAGKVVTPGTGCSSFGETPTAVTINCAGTGGGGYTPQYRPMSSDHPPGSGCQLGTGWTTNFTQLIRRPGTYTAGVDSCTVPFNAAGGLASFDMWWDGTTALTPLIRWTEVSGTLAAVQFSVNVACPTLFGTSSFSTVVSGTGTPSALFAKTLTTVSAPLNMGSCSGAQIITIQVLKVAAGSGGTVYTGDVDVLGMVI